MRKKDSRICGIDEAGRGAWAGPLIAAAIVLPFSIKRISRRAKVKVKDGKLLTSRQRKRIYGVLKRAGAQVTLEIISARSINNHGIGWANREIMRRLIKRVEADKFIVDGRLRLGRILGKTTKVQSIAHADATIPEVILAGIVAKVERDKIMQGLHRQFPEYHWRTNSGYGTKEHLVALQNHNLTYYHRSIFVTTALRKMSEKS